jgi:RNA polymerase sigma factor (sigma-70 family)
MIFYQKLLQTIRKFFTFSLIKNKIGRLLKTYDDHIIREINEGRDETLRKLYRNYRRDFMSWAKSHFKLDESILEDAFQDALEVFYRNVISGKLKSLDAPLKNYLIGIGRFKLLQYLDKNSRIDYPETLEDDKVRAVEDFLDTVISDEIEAEKLLKLKKAFNQLSDTCQLLVTKRFYEEKTIEQITQEMKYENPNTTSAALSRCLKNLRQLLG